MTDRPRAYIVAYSKWAAEVDALHDHEMTQIGRDTFLTPDGCEAVIVGDRTDCYFRGMPEGTRIYLCCGWLRRRDWRDIHALIQMGRLTPVMSQKQ